MSDAEFSMTCPVPLKDYPRVVLAHGGGGRLMHTLVQKMFLEVFGSAEPGKHHDSAVFPLGAGRYAFTTDSYVVHPVFFPGGDIGRMAVVGTVNDLAMSGARPLYLSAGFILEEGLEMEVLWRVVRSMKAAQDETGIRIVTGDTKVVDRGKADGLFINTSGVGVIEHALEISPSGVRPGDRILLSGDLGRHGIAVMASREGLSFQTRIESDLAPLAAAVSALLLADIEIHCLRDLTRGGLSSAANEIAEGSGCEILLSEDEIRVCDEVRGACEILGLDPLYAANEGRFIAFVPAEQAPKALSVLRQIDVSAGASIAGEVLSGKRNHVVLKNKIGTERILGMLSGEQLPRIC